MKQYLDMLRHVLDNGVISDNRTGIKTRSVFGYQYRVDLTKGFPLLTTKKLHLRSIVGELLWMLQGRTSNQWLKNRGISIWNEWSTKEQCAKFDREENDLGPIYGKQWRFFGSYYDKDLVREDHAPGFDQISWLLDEIQTNPTSRRLIVTAWEPREAQDVALPPCHTLFQFSVRNGRLSCHLFQRSADVFLGVPYNLASYALLTHIIAQATGLRVGEFVHSISDLHLYISHITQAKLQLQRQPNDLPTLRFSKTSFDPKQFPIAQLEELEIEYVIVDNYNPWPAIKAEVAV